MKVLHYFQIGGDVPRGQWFTGQRDLKRIVKICCPGCGTHVVLDLETHSIAKDGMVTPSLDCPVESCDFHDHVMLENWKPL